MYYEKRKSSSYAMALILVFLIVIIFILINLMRRIENTAIKENVSAELTGTNTVLNEFNLQDLAKNASYSIVRCFKIE